MQIDFAGVTFGEEERGAVKRVMDGTWLASGKENEGFEKEFARYIGTKYAVCVNSGSSANLLAMASLDLPKGSKVLTSGCGFPATLTPIIHCGLEPVLVDYDLKTHNIDLAQVEENIADVSAIIFAHTLGSPVDMNVIMNLANRHRVAVIEDCCEAVGAGYLNSKVGSLGTAGTFSFYPSHQMTALGMGGMVTTNNETLLHKLRSLRDWGKVSSWDSYLGYHTTKFEKDGFKYFPQYTYETCGYNFKLAEANAAFGREQLKRLEGFRVARQHNYDYLDDKLSDMEEILPNRIAAGADPCWFGYVLTLKHEKYNRNKFSDFLEENGIRTRPFFAGNITLHKPFLQFYKKLPVAEKLMRDSLFIGIWQGITEPQLDYISDKIHEYFDNWC